ncbi:MAG TPA: hypothetical protein DCX89_01545 [Saprospirales bacterium]|nr:hypothetical protein [Saprospirales bacterium]
MISIFHFSNAQTIQFQAGTSFSSLKHLDSYQNTILSSEILVAHAFMAGLEYINSHHFNVSSNVGIIRKGGLYKLNMINEWGEPSGFRYDRCTLDVMTFNTLLEYKYPVKDILVPFISIGPRVDYLLVYDSFFDIFNEVTTLSSFNAGVSLGAGIKYQFPGYIIGIRSDYFYNMGTIASWISDFGPTDLKNYHSTLNLTFGTQPDFKRKKK